MEIFFSDRVVWITGASSGIGEALVYAFVKGGSRVIASSNNPAELARVAEKCTGMRGSIHRGSL